MLGRNKNNSSEAHAACGIYQSNKLLLYCIQVVIQKCLMYGRSSKLFGLNEHIFATTFVVTSLSFSHIGSNATGQVSYRITTREHTCARTYTQLHITRARSHIDTRRRKGNKRMCFQQSIYQELVYKIM